MPFDKHTLSGVERAFSALKTPIVLADEQGRVLVPAQSTEKIPVAGTGSVQGIHRTFGGWRIRALDRKPPMYVAMHADVSGADDILCMAALLAQNLLSGTDEVFGGRSHVLRQVLLREIGGSELIAQAGEQGIETDLPRSVVLFQAEQLPQGSFYSVLGDLLPMTGDDELVRLSMHSAALIKDMRGIDGMDELKEYALAVLDTMQQEAGIEAVIGLGEERTHLNELGDSCTEARRAIEIGHLFKPEEKVYCYASLRLERFLLSVDRADAAYYRSLLFNRSTQRLLNSEMLRTIEMFFEKDLNLSDTARQLFIHRNTLVYRLDKVQRATGLDLRHFPDAVTFKVLNDLKKSLQDQPDSRNHNGGDSK